MQPKRAGKDLLINSDNDDDEDDRCDLDDEFTLRPSTQAMSRSLIESNSQRDSLASKMNASMTTMKQCLS